MMMSQISCKKSIVFSDKNPWKKVPIAISDNLISFGSYERKNETQLWTTDGHEVATLNNHTCEIEVLRFGNNLVKPIVASACQQAINVWDLSEDEPSCIQVGKDFGSISHLAFSQDDGSLLVCIQNEIWIINIKTNELIADITVSDGNIVMAEFCVKQTNLIVALSEARTYNICDLNEKCQIYQSCIISSSPFFSLSMHPFETFFVTGTTDGMLRVFDMSLRNSIHEFNVSTVIGKVCGEDDVGSSIINLKYWSRSQPLPEDENVIRSVLKEELYLVVACTSSILLLNANSMEMTSMIFYTDISLEDPSCTLSSAANVAFGITSHEKLSMTISSLFSNEVHVCQMEDKEDVILPQLSVLSLEPLAEHSPLKADFQPKLKQGVNKSKKVVKGKVDKMNQPLVFHGKVKSSGYTKDKPRSEMFQPKINKTKTISSTNHVGPWGLKSEVRDIGKEYPTDSVAPTKLNSEEQICENNSAMNNLSFSDSGKSLACAVSDHNALLLKMSTMKSLAFVGHNGSVNTALLNHDNNMLMTSSDDATVKLWLPEQTEPILDVSHYKHNFKTDSVKNSTETNNLRFTKAISGAQFYYNDKFMLISHGNSLLLYKYHIDPQKNDIKRYQTNNRYKLVKDFEITDCQKVSTFSAINSFYSYVAICACSNRDLVIFDVNRSQSVLTINDAHTRPVHSLCQNQGSAFVTQASEAYDLFITAAVTDGVKLWDLRVNRCVRKFEGHVNRAHKVGLAYSPCSRFIAVGSEDNSSYIYDIRSVSYLHRLSGQSDVVTAVAFHPQYPLLACGTVSGKLRTYNVK